MILAKTSEVEAITANTGQVNSSRFFVLIDPGHGGKDVGAFHEQLKESNLNLAVARLLAEKIGKEPGWDSLLTRNSDQFMTLEARVALAEKIKPNLFVSLHANSSTDNTVRGLEFYFKSQLSLEEERLQNAHHEEFCELGGNPSCKKSLPSGVEQLLAVSTEETASSPQKAMVKNSVLGNILADLETTRKVESGFAFTRLLKNHFRQRNKIKQAPFYVIDKTSAPAVLIEMGFLSNAVEAQKLMQQSYQAQLAEQIFATLKDYKHLLDKECTRSLHSSLCEKIKETGVSYAPAAWMRR